MATVLVQEGMDGENNLVAYVVPHHMPDGDDLASILRKYLQENLPKYMVPQYFIFLPALPLTPNGKLDRKSLPAPDQNAQKQNVVPVAPRSSVEQRLAAIWENKLGINHIGIYDNFFELGGHSLLAMGVISRIRSELGVDISLRTIFENPTIANFASFIEVAQIKNQEQLGYFDDTNREIGDL
jgi:acyl carrier protein